MFCSLLNKFFKIVPFFKKTQIQFDFIWLFNVAGNCPLEVKKKIWWGEQNHVLFCQNVEYPQVMHSCRVWNKVTEEILCWRYRDCRAWDHWAGCCLGPSDCSHRGSGRTLGALKLNQPLSVIKLPALIMLRQHFGLVEGFPHQRDGRQRCTLQSFWTVEPLLYFQYCNLLSILQF